jgi:hypothetical protein
MKIRNGFVSNSSSSSFMIAIGVVADWDKYDKWINSIKKSKIIDYPIELFTVKIGQQDKAIEIHDRRDRWSVEAPVNDLFEVSVKKSEIDKLPHIPIHEKAKNLLETGESGYHFAVLSIGNDEGDSSFTTEDGCDLNYDIELDRFRIEQQKIYNEFSKENGMVLIEKTFGAARNG